MLSVVFLFVRNVVKLSIVVQSVMFYYYAECRYSVTFFNVMLNIAMLSFMFCIVMLSDVRLNVVIVDVAAPGERH